MIMKEARAESCGYGYHNDFSKESFSVPLRFNFSRFGWVDTSFRLRLDVMAEDFFGVIYDPMPDIMLYGASHKRPDFEITSTSLTPLQSSVMMMFGNWDVGMRLVLTIKP
jgi:hypothetical protein